METAEYVEMLVLIINATFKNNKQKGNVCLKIKIIALISQSGFSTLCLIVVLQYKVHFDIICCHGYW